MYNRPLREHIKEQNIASTAHGYTVNWSCALIVLWFDTETNTVIHTLV